MPELIIFDCDGVLIDSEIIGCREEARALTEAGIPITTEEVVKRFTGMQTSVLRKILEDEYQVKIPDGFEAMVSARVKEAFENELERISGSMRLLRELKKANTPFCIASGSDRERLRHTLTKTGLWEFFGDERVFSAEQVSKGKPAPDIFHLCALKMHASPPRCIVLEDSVAGIKGAVAAGMYPIGFVGGRHCTKKHPEMLKEAGAKHIINKLSELPELIKREWL